MKCTKCGEVGGPFVKNRSLPGGTTKVCRSCWNASGRAYREAHLEEHRAYNRDYASLDRLLNPEKVSARRKKAYRNQGPPWNNFKARAKRRGIEVCMSRDDFCALWAQTNCPICAVSFDRAQYWAQLSIDRLDSSLPYTRNNCAALCRRCNTRKNDSTPGQLRQIADWIDAQQKHLLASDNVDLTTKRNP